MIFLLHEICPGSPCKSATGVVLPNSFLRLLFLLSRSRCRFGAGDLFRVRLVPPPHLFPPPLPNFQRTKGETERGQFELNTLTFGGSTRKGRVSSLRRPSTRSNSFSRLQMAVSKKQASSPSPPKKEGGQLRDSEKRSF